MIVTLPQRCEVWRWILKPAGGRSLRPWRSNVSCLIEPISNFDRVPAFARESTHLVLLPTWLADLNPEDEIRTGRRTDASGAVSAIRYHVDGLRPFRFGCRHVEFFCKEIA